ncbi:MAG: dTMP kinase [Spirulina sp. SIO3F2]|nr:dTMP kinase [Spirulina sp. SIO3F2]
MTQVGRFIVFEGVEGAGKTTQIRLTAAYLQNQVNVSVQVTREPGGTKLGQSLRQLLLHDSPMNDRTELLLFAADRAEHVQTVLQPALDQNTIVLCDRYTDSTLAYQHYGRGIERQVIEQLNTIATGGLTSDLTFWLDLDVSTGLGRSQKNISGDRIERADVDFHQRVQAGFAALAQQFPDRIIPIDATQTVQQIQTEIQFHLAERLGLGG